MGEAVGKVPMLTLPKETITIPENEPIPLDMVLRDVPGATPDLLDGVTAKAFTRYVTVDGQRIGQLVLTAVTKEDRIEELPHDLFVSQFEIKTAPVLPTAEEVTIEGDQDTMIAALMRLQEKEETEQAEKKEQESRDSRNGPDGAAGSSGRSSNPDAANYQSPDKLKVQAARCLPECQPHPSSILQHRRLVGGTGVVSMDHSSPSHSGGEVMRRL
jgi:hypothetical protein